MKRLKIILLATSVVMLCGCSSFVVDENTLDFTVQNVRSKKVKLEIIPKNNDFYYVYGIVSAEEYKQYDSDKSLIEADFKEQERICNSLNEFLKEYGYPTRSIEEMCFYTGAVEEAVSDLQPETDYYAYAYCLNSRKRPIYTLIKRPFTTTTKPHSDITFKVEATENHLIEITPSNSDSYYWEAVSKQSVFDYYELDINDTTYDASTMVPLWFGGLLYINYMWDFELSSTGKQEVDLTSLIEGIKDNDIFYLGCVGFEEEETSENYLYEITYHNDRPADIKQVDDWMAEEPDEVQQMLLRRQQEKRRTAAALRKNLR